MAHTHRSASLCDQTVHIVDHRSAFRITGLNYGVQMQLVELCVSDIHPGSILDVGERIDRI